MRHADAEHAHPEHPNDEETLTAHVRLHAFSGRLAGELVAYLPARVLEAAGG